MIFVYFILGCAAWTFIEYGMHHWNGHLLKGRTHFSREHLKHHVLVDYFSPISHKVITTVGVVAVITGIGAFVLHWSVGFTFAMGVVAGYGIYEYVHWANHQRPPRSAYARWARRHHFSHHFTDARFNHGVTTPIWDIVFGTYRAPVQIRVPRKLAMGWLLDERGELETTYSGDYALIGRRVAG